MLGEHLGRRRESQLVQDFPLSCCQAGGLYFTAEAVVSDVDGTDSSFSDGTQNNSSISYINERVCCPKVNANVVGKQALNLREHEFGLTGSEVKSHSGSWSRLLTRLERWEIMGDEAVKGCDG